MSDTLRKPTWSIAVASTLLSGVVLYSTFRAGQVAFTVEPDPARALFDPHSGFTWRLLASLYAAGMLLPLHAWLAASRPPLAARVLRALVIGAPVALVAQAAFFP